MGFFAKGIFLKAKFCQEHVNKYGLSKLVLFYYLWQKVIFTICRQTEVFVCICSHGATILYLSTYAVCPLYFIEFINLQLLRMGLFMSRLEQNPKTRQRKIIFSDSGALLWQNAKCKCKTWACAVLVSLHFHFYTLK